jgi:hypothetical protein
MVAAIKQTLTVKDDGILEIHSPELRSGSRVEVTVLVEDAERPLPTMSAWFGAGRGRFKSVEEIDAYIREERDWGGARPMSKLANAIHVVPWGPVLQPRFSNFQEIV